MIMLTENRQIVLELEERNTLKGVMVTSENPEIFEAIRKMLVRNYSQWWKSHWQHTEYHRRFTEYHHWRTCVTENFFNKRPTHKSRNPRKAKNKHLYHTDVNVCRRRIKKVETELRNTMVENRRTLQERQHWETQLYQLRLEVEQNLVDILENHGIVGMEDITTTMRTRTMYIISRIKWCDDKLVHSALMSAQMSNELIDLRQTEWNLVQRL
jgi:hypothetical protein